MNQPAMDWENVRRELAEAMRRLAGGRVDHPVDDLVQEAAVRFLRASRRVEVRDVRAFAITIARRTWTDHLRRTIRERARRSDEADPAELPDPEPGASMADDLAFAVHELLTSANATDCLSLFRSFLLRVDWAEVAEETGSTHAAVRKRWSRCLEHVRRSLRADPEFSRWFRDDGRPAS